MNTPDSARDTVLVTGSSGLIGSRLVPALAPRFSVIGIDVEPPEGDTELAAFFGCDLTDDDSVRETFERIRHEQGGRIASAIHLAAYHDFSGEPSPRYDALNVEGTRRVLHALRHFEFAAEQLVLSSTVLVMKPSEDGRPIDESGPLEAEWDYPRSMLEAERVIEEDHGTIPVAILRVAGVYDDEGHSLPIAQHVRRIREKKLESYFFPGHADHGQAFVHVDDVTDCIVRVVDARHDLEPYEVFLVGEPEVMSYRELQERIGVMLHGKEWPTVPIPGPVAKAGAWVKDKAPVGEEPFIKPWMIDLADAHYAVAIDRARERLGWRPARRLRHTLDQMLNRLVEDPVSWYEANGLPLPDDLEDRADPG